jgi:hypothetical protein
MSNKKATEASYGQQRGRGGNNDDNDNDDKN